MKNDISHKQMVNFLKGPVMKFDDILESLGSFGSFQRKMLMWLSLPVLCCGLHKFAWVFLGAIPAHRCRLPYDFDNSTYLEYPEAIMNMSYPWDAVRGRWDRCRMINENFTQDYFNSNIPGTLVTTCTNGYIYDKSIYQSSIPMDWNLVCDKLVLHATTQALFMVGVLIGSLAFGILSDSFGRRPTLLLSLTLITVCGILGGVISDFISFTAMRMIVGACTSGIFITSFVICMEMSGANYKVLVGTAFQCFFAVGYLLTALFAYIIRGWQMLQVAISAIGFIFVVHWWLIPESPRWLLQQGRVKDAKQVLKKIAKENGTTVPHDAFTSDNIAILTSKRIHHDKWQFVSAIKYPNLRKKSLILCLNWCVISGVYYGLSLNSSNIGGNDYINFLIFAASEIPAYILGYLLLDRIGRRVTLCGSLFLGGATMLLMPALDYERSTWAIVLAMVGKFGITSAYNVIYIFSAELFPTVMRTTCVGVCSMCARVGGIIAPYILLLSSTWPPLPFIVFGGCSIITGLVALLLPETSGTILPETIEDGESFGKSVKSEPEPVVKEEHA